jgi:hypothetical protein
MADVPERINALETQTQEKVSDSLSKIEVALADWEAARKKPKVLARRMEYLALSRAVLSGWMKDSLLGRKDPRSAAERLRRFSAICRRLDSERPV